MTVILVLATFLVFIVLDYALNRRKAVATAPALIATATQSRTAKEPVTIQPIPTLMGIMPTPIPIGYGFTTLTILLR